MEADEVMKLFESHWFELQIFKKQPTLSNLSRIGANPDHEIEEKPSKPEILRNPTKHTRSISDELSSKTGFNFSSSISPDSVHRPKLSTILSGREATETETPKQRRVEEEPSTKVNTRRRRKKGESKSLTDLQFEELKGFMDLGFVFLEEDKEDSNLASIIPGLQRLGKKVGQEEGFDESAIPRPYLSEAWKVMEQRKREKPLMNWRFPYVNNEIDMKDNLRWWAHTVASAVR